MSEDLETAPKAALEPNVTAALLVAAAERGAIDPERVFKLLDVIATGLEGGAVRARESESLAAIILRSIEPTYRSMTQIPTGAGRA